MILGLVSLSIKDTFWSLSRQVRVPLARKGVMARLWLMPSPGGHNRINIYSER